VRADRAGGRVRVTVADEGTGIAAEDMAQLFRPFFTTKGEKGTGLGLWLAHSSLRRLGGSIAARNRAARGAEFVVELLLAKEAGRVTPRRAAGRRRQRIARRG
jgi:C4-dicarboxylate-specific signal transduction histidine kinase